MLDCIGRSRRNGTRWRRKESRSVVLLAQNRLAHAFVQTVRRDNCRLVVTVIETCLRKMLIDRDVKGAEEYTKQTISDLLQNKVDLSQLVITKALVKAGQSPSLPWQSLES